MARNMQLPSPATSLTRMPCARSCALNSVHAHSSVLAHSSRPRPPSPPPSRSRSRRHVSSPYARRWSFAAFRCAERRWLSAWCRPRAACAFCCCFFPTAKTGLERTATITMLRSPQCSRMFRESARSSAHATNKRSKRKTQSYSLRETLSLRLAVLSLRARCFACVCVARARR